MQKKEKVSAVILLICVILLISLAKVQIQPISAQISAPTNNSEQYTVLNEDTPAGDSQKYGLPLKEILAEKGIPEANANLKIVVDKSDHVLSLFSNDMLLKTYHVELGDNGLEDKAIAGDHKTPEGTFYISEKLVLDPRDEFLGSRWMRLSYPNIEDADRGLRDGLIDQQTHGDIVTAFNQGKVTPQRTALGGGVGIHGGGTPQLGKDWTWGCVGLTDADVEDFYEYVDVGTLVIIQP